MQYKQRQTLRIIKQKTEKSIAFRWNDNGPDGKKITEPKTLEYWRDAYSPAYFLPGYSRLLCPIVTWTIDQMDRIYRRLS